MSYKELEIGNSYISKGNNNIADSFLVPVLKHTVKYNRSVGFFSSGVINEISEGIMALVRNHGTIQLIASPELSEADIEAINLGYEQRQKYIEDRFSDEFVQEVEKLDDTKLQFLRNLQELRLHSWDYTLSLMMALLMKRSLRMLKRLQVLR